MRMLFKSQDLWEIIEEGFTDRDEAARLKENKRKVAKVLFYLQQAVDEKIFPRIMNATSSKEAWIILHNMQLTVKTNLCSQNPSQLASTNKLCSGCEERHGIPIPMQGTGSFEHID